MIERRGLYYAFCLASSAKEVLKGSCTVARDSFGQWVTTSTLTRPLLMEYQWFHDPKWEKARKLSEGIRASGLPQQGNNHKSRTGVRHYSSHSKSKGEKVCK